jgi:type II secretory pathway pseudopilin PulG
MMQGLPASSASAPAAQGPVLRDIHLPPDPSWWPPAPGWWLLAALLVAIALIGVLSWRRQRKRRVQRERVLGELDAMQRQYASDGDHAALAGGMHQLLRRVARRHDALAAQQRGSAWRQTLSRVPIDAATLDQLVALEEVMYRAPSSFDQAASSAAVRQWVRLALKPGKWKRDAKTQNTGGSRS